MLENRIKEYWTVYVKYGVYNWPVNRESTLEKTHTQNITREVSEVNKEETAKSQSPYTSWPYFQLQFECTLLSWQYFLSSLGVWVSLIQMSDILQSVNNITTTLQIQTCPDPT